MDDIYRGSSPKHSGGPIESYRRLSQPECNIYSLEAAGRAKLGLERPVQLLKIENGEATYTIGGRRALVVAPAEIVASVGSGGKESPITLRDLLSRYKDVRTTGKI